MGNLETFNKREYVESQCQCEKPKTNADAIRNMSDEELAEFLVDVNSAYALECMIGEVVCKHENTDKDCKDCFLDWLQSEVKEGAE